MAKSDEYMEEAYDALKELSADDRAKLEYEAREKAIRDYNSQMSSALRRGRKKGMEEGLRQGIGRGQLLNRIELIQKKCRKGKSLEQIADEIEEEVADIEKLYLMVKENPEMPAEQFLQNFEEALLPAGRNK